MNRILVTGGAGFVGSNLVRRLQEMLPQASIVVVDDFRSGCFANLTPEGPEPWSFAGQVIARPLHELDIDALVDRIEPDVIFHEASITDTTVSDQATMIRHNVEPFEALLQAASRRKLRLVWASSGATYGTLANGATPQQRPFRLEDAGHPANVYGFSKWIMENLHRRALAADPNLHSVGLRYFNVFGPGEAHKGKMASMIYQLAQQMLAGKRPRIFRDGQQARDHVYVKDVVEATIAAANPTSRSGVYNVGTGQATTFNQVVAALNQGLGTNLEPDYFDNPYSFYQNYTCADLTQTRAGLNWSPRYSTTQAIAQYVQWLAQSKR